MSATTNTETKNLTNWSDGIPSANVQVIGTDNGKVTYWIDGQPYAYLYPTESNTSNFMLFMPF